jgi:adenylate kinase family enzyme
MMQRILIIGSGGAGKSTLARQLAARLGLTHTELDSLYWLPDWAHITEAEFLARVDAVTSEPHWVLCGNYSTTQTITFKRADTVIWLDYPLLFIFGRLLKRTVQRVVTRENLWGSGNRETLRNAFFSRDSLLLYILKTHRRRSTTFARLMSENTNPSLTWLRFTSPRDTDAWLRTLPSR